MTLDTIKEKRVKLNQHYDCCWSSAWALDMLDDIEQEIAERYMELPVDAEGVPIHLGDMVEGELLFDNATVKGTVTTYHIHSDDEPGTVYIKVKPTENTWTIKELRFTRCRHVKQRTLEDVLASYRFDAQNIYEDPMLNGNQRVDELEALDSKVADEIRGMMA
ncbi:MAG: hypothetical protein IKF78_00680 [Atopobiaceae bacterium]|nr:hypothetical protein [Atopobiaceae bacterium]